MVKGISKFFIKYIYVDEIYESKLRFLFHLYNFYEIKKYMFILLLNLKIIK